MSKILLSALLLVPTFLVAQVTNGSITYQETIKIEIELPPEMESMRDQIPKSQTSKRILYFNDEASIFMDVPEDTEDKNVQIGSDSGDGFRFAMNFMRPDNKTYRNWAEEKLVEKTDFMGRTFLITGNTTPFAWKLTGEQATVLGYLCMRAEFSDSLGITEAWFTPQIPAPIGPGNFGGLPGAILKMTTAGGKVEIVATAVAESLEDTSIVKAPSEGKAVTREEYLKIMEDKMKEMEAEMGTRGGNRIMIRGRN